MTKIPSKKELRRRLRLHINKYPAISKETGLQYWWLCRLSTGDQKKVDVDEAKVLVKALDKLDKLESEA